MYSAVGVPVLLGHSYGNLWLVMVSETSMGDEGLIAR